MTRVDPSQEQPPREAPHQVVGRAVQDLAAARLGRGFIPLALLFLLGLGQLLTHGSGGDGLVVVLGAPVAAVAMLSYGLRTVQTAFGRPRRTWMALATVGSVLPPAYGVWVLGWPGLRSVARWEGPATVVAGLVYAALGVWVLRAWLRLLELQRLSVAMSVEAPQGEEGA